MLSIFRSWPGCAQHSNIKARVSVHWLAQCHAKWPWDVREFKHPARITVVKPMLHKALQLALSTKPWVCFSLPKKQYTTRHISQPWTDFVQDCHSQIVHDENQGQTRYTKFLTLNLLCYQIGQRLELKYFLFLLNEHWAAHRPQKSENWELKI